MTKLLLIPLILIGCSAFSKNICFPGDEKTALDFAGPRSQVKSINYDFNVIDLVEQGVKAEEKSYGTKTFITIYDGTRSSFKTVCVRIPGQQYMENACQVCIEKY